MTKKIKIPSERRLDIINAARDLLQTKGYHKATMQDVMEALDIAKGTIYHYFKSKDALLEAVIENIVDANIEHMHNLLRKTKGSAIEKIKTLATASDLTINNPDIIAYLHQPNNAAIHTKLLANTLMRQAPLYAALIKQGCEENIFKTDTPLECAEFILSAIQFLTDQGIHAWTEADLKRRTLAFPKLIEHMLQAPNNSFNFMLDRISK